MSSARARSSLSINSLARATTRFALGIRCGQPRDQTRHVERLLERRHLADHVARGLALGLRVLREHGWRSSEEHQTHEAM